MHAAEHINQERRIPPQARASALGLLLTDMVFLAYK